MPSPRKKPQNDNSNDGQDEFKIDLQGLIKLLAKNLYAEPDVFVREMLQNAHDSIKRRRELQGESTPEGVVRVKIDHEAATITFIDNGAGMTEQEVRDYLSTIGRSGTEAFRQDLIKKGRQAEVTVIGQFGIGLLSAFIVADRVVVETLSWQPNQPAWRWESSGEKTYNLQPGQRNDAGSVVTLYINDNYRDMLLVDELRQAIRKYADFLPISIYLNDEEAPSNTINAPWHKSYGEMKDEVADMTMLVIRRFPSDYPLSIIPIHLQKPHKVDGVLYVSERRTLDVNTTGLVDVYQSRMFIVQANRDMLPSWAKFVRGIIDSPALTPTASRDAVQQDSVQKEIKEQLGEAIIQHLIQLSKDSPRKFQQICEWHHWHLKGMAAKDETFFYAVADLVPFETNQGLMNLKMYFEESKKRGQLEHDLLYFDESGSSTQFNMLCDARGLLVINASRAFESSFLERYGRLHPEIRLRQLDIGESDVIFEPPTADEQVQYHQLEQEFTRTLPDRRSIVRAVRFKPESIPALTVLSAAAKTQRRLQEVEEDILLPEDIRSLVRDVLQGERSIPFTLYLNVDNPTIQQLAKMSPTEDTQDAYQAIFINAAMLTNRMNTPQNAEAAFRGFSRVIDRMIIQTDRVQKLEAQLVSLKMQLKEKEKDLQRQVEAQGNWQTEHISCFFAMPFDEDYAPLLAAVKRILEDAPYGWQVVRADDRLQGTTITENVRNHIAQSHCYLAEISDGNPNVFLEIGRMSHYEGRPLIYLCRRDAEQRIAADLKGHLYFAYEKWHSNQPDVEQLAEQLRDEFARRGELMQLRSNGKKTYLSPDLLVRYEQCNETLARKIGQKYKTVEEFIQADHMIIAQALDVSKRADLGAIEDAQAFLKKHFSL